MVVGVEVDIMVEQILILRDLLEDLVVVEPVKEQEGMAILHQHHHHKEIPVDLVVTEFHFTLPEVEAVVLDLQDYLEVREVQMITSMVELVEKVFKLEFLDHQ